MLNFSDKSIREGWKIDAFRKVLPDQTWRGWFQARQSVWRFCRSDGVHHQTMWCWARNCNVVAPKTGVQRRYSNSRKASLISFILSQIWGIHTFMAHFSSCISCCFICVGKHVEIGWYIFNNLFNCKGSKNTYFNSFCFLFSLVSNNSWLWNYTSLLYRNKSLQRVLNSTNRQRGWFR